MLEPVKPKKLYEDIVDYFVQSIQSGELKPGDQLPTEKELADRMRVSKTAVREAMSALESMGYTRSRVGEGTFVSDVTLDSLLQPVSMMLSQDRDMVENLLELRVILETKNAELAARRITEEQKEELLRIQEEMDREVGEGSTASDVDARFHGFLAQCAGNSVLARIFEMCHAPLEQTIEMVMRQPGSPVVACKKHREIIDAILKGNDKLAAKKIREHLEENYSALRNRRS